MNRVKVFQKDNLTVEVFQDRLSLGKSAAKYVESVILSQLKEKEDLRIIFAAAPSQNEMLEKLTSFKTIDWSRIIAFHMDEYIGLSKSAPQLFSNYLERNLFSKVNFKKVYKINSEVRNTEAECERYSSLLTEKEIDLVCMGIGENGHIAFNDPPVADFNDKKIVKVVELDAECRQQQVNDKCFRVLEEVPKYAITLTIPTLMSANVLSIVVPGKSKAIAIANTLCGKISTECPAAIVRKHKSTRLFIDKDSYSLTPNDCLNK